VWFVAFGTVSYGFGQFGMVWCCLVWFWFGLVWCGFVWFGVVRCGLVWFGVVWCGLVWCGLVWFGVVLCGLVSFGMVWYGLVWFCMVWYGLVWFGMVWRFTRNYPLEFAWCIIFRFAVVCTWFHCSERLGQRPGLKKCGRISRPCGFRIGAKWGFTSADALPTSDVLGRSLPRIICSDGPVVRSGAGCLKDGALVGRKTPGSTPQPVRTTSGAREFFIEFLHVS
jgi:hypothetical protein